MYHSDSDESLVHRYQIYKQQQPPRPLSTLSLNTLDCRRRSNPDIYPGLRRYSTSYSQEDILSNDQLDQIHFDPRYRDYRSASSLTYNRSRSNSLNSVGSGGNMINNYQHFRRLSSHSPPLINVPLMPPKRWDTNPSIFIEEYRDDEHSSNSKSKSNSRSAKNSRETLCSSNDSLLPLNESDIKSCGDLSKIPFIDDDSNDSSDNPGHISMDNINKKLSGIISNGNQQQNQQTKAGNCRKTVSFDVIAGKQHSSHMQPKLFSSNGKNYPQIPKKSNPYPTDSVIPPPCRTNLRTTRDGINRTPPATSTTSTSIRYSTNSKKDNFKFPKVPNSSSCDDHCTLFEKLIRLKMEEERSNLHGNCCRRSLSEFNRHHFQQQQHQQQRQQVSSKDESLKFSEGKVKALTTYFNTLPFLSDDCKCAKIYQSTPDLSSTMTCRNDKLSAEEMKIVRTQLKEWSEFGLKSEKATNCEFFTRNCYNEEDSCRRKMCQSLNDLTCCCCERFNTCDFQPRILRIPPPGADKHRCRSACFNINRKSKKIHTNFISADDNNPSLII
jgi:hypothetical protein